MTATQAPTPGPLSGDDVKLLVKLLDTLKPFAEVAEKLKHCHVVEICEPSPDNPSRNIIPMPREWFERAGDDLEAIVIQLHAAGVLSEGQAAKMTGLDRVAVRRLADCLAPTAPVEASGSEREDEPTEPEMQRAEVVSALLRYSFEGGAACDVADEIIGLLRPQPSGETREAVARVEAELSHPARVGSKCLVDAGDLRALLSARPLALGGQQGEDAAWSWLNQHVECDPADRDYSADEMVDAFMAGNGRYDRLVKALERIAGEHQYRSGYCQTDIAVEPALTAEEAQTVARDALSTTPARAEAQDEGAAGWIVGNSEDNRWRSWDQGGPVWVDDRARATRYARREDAEAVHAEDEDAWCVKPYPSPTPAADDDRVRIAVEALEYYAGPHAMPNDGPWGASSDDYGRRAAEAIADLKLGHGK